MDGDTAAAPLPAPSPQPALEASALEASPTATTAASQENLEKQQEQQQEQQLKQQQPFDAETRSVVRRVPLLRVKAGPRDDLTLWQQRLKEEYHALIELCRINKQNDNDWCKIQAEASAAGAPAGTKWTGSCSWFYQGVVRYDFDFEVELGAAYPAAPPTIRIPSLDGKTVKMYHGGSICLDVHFTPLWSRNCPRFGVAHALALGLAPWLAAELPDLVRRGVVVPRSASA